METPEGTKRAYKSDLRAARAEATRSSIVEAAAALLGEDLSGLTMPAVAKRAGVSLPTVYRYFADKAQLRDAVVASLRNAMGVNVGSATDFEGIMHTTRRAFEGVEEQGDGVLNVLAAASAERLDPETVEKRHAYTRDCLRDQMRGIRGKDRERLVQVASVLCSSSGGLSFARFGSTGAAGAQLVRWTIETLVLGMKARAQASKAGAKS